MRARVNKFETHIPLKILIDKAYIISLHGNKVGCTDVAQEKKPTGRDGTALLVMLTYVYTTQETFLPLPIKNEDFEIISIKKY